MCLDCTRVEILVHTMTKPHQLERVVLVLCLGKVLRDPETHPTTSHTTTHLYAEMMLCAGCSNKVGRSVSKTSLLPQSVGAYESQPHLPLHASAPCSGITRLCCGAGTTEM